MSRSVERERNREKQKSIKSQPVQHWQWLNFEFKKRKKNTHTIHVWIHMQPSSAYMQISSFVGAFFLFVSYLFPILWHHSQHEFLLIFDHFDDNRSVRLFLERELLMYISNKNGLFIYIRAKMIAHETFRRRLKTNKIN